MNTVVTPQLPNLSISNSATFTAQIMICMIYCAQSWMSCVLLLSIIKTPVVIKARCEQGASVTCTLKCRQQVVQWLWDKCGSRCLVWWREPLRWSRGNRVDFWEVHDKTPLLSNTGKMMRRTSECPPVQKAGLFTTGLHRSYIPNELTANPNPPMATQPHQEFQQLFFFFSLLFFCFGFCQYNLQPISCRSQFAFCPWPVGLSIELLARAESSSPMSRDRYTKLMNSGDSIWKPCLKDLTGSDGTAPQAGQPQLRSFGNEKKKNEMGGDKVISPAEGPMAKAARGGQLTGVWRTAIRG